MDLRQLWPREAADFTSWLAEQENLDELGRALGLEFRSCEREVAIDDVALYLVRVRAYRIDGSRAAPHFSVVAGPVAERKRTERDVRELAERHQLRYEFWQGFLERARTSLKRFARLSPTTDYWIRAGTGVGGFYLVALIGRDGGGVRLYVDMGPGREAETKEAFRRLQERRADIEREFGAPLEWDPGEGVRKAEVSYRVPVDAGFRDRERWPELWEAMVQALARLERAVEPPLKGLTG